jgi:hypothetical protein
MERGEFAAARWSLGRAAERFPGSITLRLLHADAALREGLEREAEAALLSVLELAPDHPRARQNLSVIRARRMLRPGEEITLGALYTAACNSDEQTGPILRLIHDLAKGCRTVTEIGAGRGDVTAALLWARPGRVHAYDQVKAPEIDLLEALAGKTPFEFHTMNGAALDIDPTDLLVVRAENGDATRIVGACAAKVSQTIVVVGEGSDFGELDGEFRAVPERAAGCPLVILERVAKRGDASTATVSESGRVA